MIALIATIAAFAGIGGAYFYTKRKKPTFTISGVQVFLVEREKIPDYEEMHRTAAVLDLLQSKNLPAIKDERSIWANFGAKPIDSSALRLAVQRGIDAFLFRANILDLPKELSGKKIKIANYPATRWVGARHHIASHGMALVSDNAILVCCFPSERGGMNSLSSVVCHEMAHLALAKKNGDPDYHHSKKELWGVIDSAVG